MKSIESRIDYIKNNLAEIKNVIPVASIELGHVAFGVNGSWTREDYKVGDGLDLRAFHAEFLPDFVEKDLLGNKVKLYTSSREIDERQIEESRGKLDAKILRLCSCLVSLEDRNREIEFLREKANLYLKYPPLSQLQYREKKSIVRQDINASLSKIKSHIEIISKNKGVIPESIINFSSNDQVFKSYRDKLPYIFCVLINKWRPRNKHLIEYLRGYNPRFSMIYDSLSKMEPSNTGFAELLLEGYKFLENMSRATLPR
jgi:hypothetical protein